MELETERLEEVSGRGGHRGGRGSFLLFRFATFLVDGFKVGTSPFLLLSAFVGVLDARHAFVRIFFILLC